MTSNPHPLDRPVWSSLTGRQTHLAIVEGGARRYDPAYGVFGAVADHSAASLASLGALVASHGDVAMADADPPTAAPGVAVHSRDQVVQMVVTAGLTPGPAPDIEILSLGEADAPEMLALATLTQPGPFFARTHQMGDFFGVRAGGRLVAMAGERMKPEGHTEVSGVCTAPEYRGRGYAAALTRMIAGRILDRGETPFLHAFAGNRGAIGLYQTLGFSLRREVIMTRLTRA